MSCTVRFPDLIGDMPARGQLVTLRGRPFSNLFCALASPAGSTMHSSTDASCMIDVQGESAMEIPGVLGLQIDPVVDTVARERTGLLFFVLDRSPVVTFDHNRARDSSVPSQSNTRKHYSEIMFVSQTMAGFDRTSRIPAE